MAKSGMDIINHYDAANFIERIGTILQRSLLTELLMDFIPLDEWPDSFMLTVENPKQVLCSQISFG